MVGLVVVAAVVLVAAGLVAAAQVAVARAGRGLVYGAELVPEREVALVLGAKVYRSGRLSAVLEDRVRTAVALYEAGKVRKLLMSGDNSRDDYDEVTAMRNFALRLGVPEDDVVRDFAGLRTYDSLVRARDVWGLDRLTIVTQGFHLPRSLYLAKGLGLDAVGVGADRRQYASARRMALREMAARVRAVVDVRVLRPHPRHLGPRESLSGLAQRGINER